MSVNYNPQIIKDELTLYVDAENAKSYPGTGTTWKDLSKTKNHLTLLNGASYQNGSMVFDGVNDVAMATTSQTKQVNMAWEAWVKRYLSVNNFNMFMGENLPYFAARPGSAGFFFSNYINSTQKSLATNGITIQDNVWYFTSFTTEFDGTNTTMKIYVNGEFNNQATNPGPQTSYINPSKFSIGDGRSTTAWYPFNGEVSNVKIYHKTLSPAEIKQNFNASRGRFGV